MNEELAERHALALGATLGPPGRLLPGLEERVRRRHHDHVCVFNANVCLLGGKLWWGEPD